MKSILATLIAIAAVSRRFDMAIAAPTSLSLAPRTGSCIEVHVYIQNNPFEPALGDCATFQLWRNGNEVGTAYQCLSLASSNSNFNVGFSDGTTAATNGQANWIAVSGITGLNLNIVDRQSGTYTAGGFGSHEVKGLEFEAAGNTAHLDANGCAGYSNAQTCDFMAKC